MKEHRKELSCDMCVYVLVYFIINRVKLMINEFYNA